MTSKERFTKIENFLATLAEVQVQQAQDIRGLYKMQKNLVSAVAKVAEAQLRTEESLQHTDERLNALIAVVDRLVKRNGKS